MGLVCLREDMGNGYRIKQGKTWKMGLGNRKCEMGLDTQISGYTSKLIVGFLNLMGNDRNKKERIYKLMNGSIQAQYQNIIIEKQTNIDRGYFINQTRMRRSKTKQTRKRGKRKRNIPCWLCCFKPVPLENI